MATKKPTKREMFAQILEKYPLTTQEREFLQHEQELLAKKNAPKDGKSLTPAQKENEGIKQGILDFLSANADKKFTITDLIKQVPACEGMTNQKVSALVRQLVDGLLVVRTEEKGKALFSIA